LKRFQSLVPSWWLEDIITRGTAPEFENKKVVLCHTYYHDKNAYDKGHIPHAIALDTELFETPQTWNRRSPSELRHSLEQSGITADTIVILYGRDIVSNGSESHPGANAGHLSAMRVACIMLYAGVTDVRILNGGMQAWVDAGYSLSMQPYIGQPVSDFGTHIPSHPEIIIDIEDVQSILKAHDRNLVCVCSRPEFEGHTSGYNYIEKKGHIPGSVLIENGSDAYHMESYRNPDQTTREYHEIEHLWLDHGLSPEKNTVFYCGTGWRASEAYINAWLIGWQNCAVYDGGWLEWSRMVS
jgi:thiosulfate/3-mercaptopyruvate sulfurtransferase